MLNIAELAAVANSQLNTTSTSTTKDNKVPSKDSAVTNDSTLLNPTSLLEAACIAGAQAMHTSKHKLSSTKIAKYVYFSV